MGTELRRIRERTGPSLTEVAAMLGTDRTTISNVESGRFGVKPRALLSGAKAGEFDDLA
ncbi:helix-turn-helix domain-containing protein [Streptomyces brevispora]|uniref:helix-turn-helix domain-containing protein n=1 Tax=Streptomyces brevispora TaxID=887462 RepID=UPI002E33037E|nr:helix-turn-helix transcriptional regulator [Streptomyces brevispora]